MVDGHVYRFERDLSAREAQMNLPERRTGRAPSGDVEIFFRHFGVPGKTPVIIVHGLSYFSYDWMAVAAELARDREVVAIDMRGFGQSGWSATHDYRLRSLSDDVVAVLDHLGWDRAVLVGHSMGGRICLLTAGVATGSCRGACLSRLRAGSCAGGAQGCRQFHRQAAGCLRNDKRSAGLSRS